MKRISSDHKISINRRKFMKIGFAGGAALFVPWYFKLPEVLAQIPGGTLNAGAVPKFRTPLLTPPQMPRAGILWDRKLRKFVDYYEIAMRQFNQQILPAGLPATPVWGYGPARALSPRAPMIFNAPSLTLEANYNRPVRIKWINELKDAAGNYLPHLLPVDPTLHWANPPGGPTGRDTRPQFDTTPGPYTGPVPMVTHVHGAVGVGDESDGYAEAWYLPAANDLPAGYATEGSWYEFFSQKAASKFGVAWGPGFAVFQYPNVDRASTNWYHDHTLGMTRLNVYAGPAGFYIIRGGPAGDLAVRDTRTGRLAFLPRPAPSEIDQILKMHDYHEIPMAIQDRSFNTDGSLFYPDTRDFFDGITGPYIPETDISPLWNPEFFGNMMMVNGNTWPYLEVERRRYRFRFLNGCQSRFLILSFNEIPGVEVWVIGNEGGFLSAPVNLTENHGNQLLMGLAERADMIVDFSNVPPGNYILGNGGPDEPFRGFNADGSLADGEGGSIEPADTDSTGKILEFRVRPGRVLDLTTPPRFLRLPAITPLPKETRIRPLALLEDMSMDFDDAPAAALLGTISGNPNEVPGVLMRRMWMDPVTENPAVGSTEVWEFYNATGDAHPIHLHEVVFEVVNRQEIEVDDDSRTVQVVPGSAPQPPVPWETGFKDTVIAYPGQVTRIRARFNTPGQYTWHCHIVEHEDNEMMRPYRIGPVQAGQPAPTGGHSV